MSERSLTLLITAAVTAMLALQPAALSATPLPSSKPSAKTAAVQTKVVKAKSAKSNLPPELQLVRKRLLAGKSVPYLQLQALADQGDSIGAFRMGERLNAQKDPGLATDALHYFSIAVYQNRAYAVGQMVEILSRTDVKIAPAHLEQAEIALRAQALRGNEKAIDSLIRFYSEGKPFGTKRDQLEALLKTAAGSKNAESAFRLAVMLLSEPSRTPDQTEQAVRYLSIATKNGSIGVQASASNLLATLDKAQTHDNSGVQP
jgi:TPR repeat protein